MKILIASTAFLAGSLAVAPTTFAQGSDDCATATAIATTGAHNFDSTAATTGTQGQIECGSIQNDVWFVWTSPSAGTAVVSTCTGATFDTKLAAYPGAACPADGTSLACNDDACALQSNIIFPVTAGGIYMLQVGSFSSSASGVGSIDITILPPLTEDDCATPGTWAGEGFFQYDCTLATTGVEGQNEFNCDAFSTMAVGFDVWYTWTPSVSGDATFSTCPTTSWDTKIALWPGTGCPVDGTSITCNDDTCALQSEIYASVIAGQQYTLQLGAYPFTGTHTAAEIEISIIPSGIGTPYCSVNPNSTGSPALMDAQGSASIAANNLTIAAQPVPTQPGIFFHADNQLEVPFGNGFLCAGGTIVRMAPSVPAADRAEVLLDLPSISIIAPGTANFQYWFRDPAAGGAFFNTSNGLAVTFVP